MASWPTYRTVVLDQRAQVFVDAHAVANGRFDEQWQGIEWLICRMPEKGLPRHAHEPTKFLLFVVAGNDLAETKEVWVLYSYDDNDVTVHAVAFAPEAPEANA
ncbi:hypothetical protein C7I87_19515 [Mesorhizobium sp. SARCC-RB16n]|uniref:hypothetical protein n=1 Tax=Mesorhizobium sp. SARCC-RB16n TaxID=2116687 RepID=UPI00122F605D|nr:hypothetical protein [Mesorhizobium sp. SARCC-RB16n]KAA3448861.1 hypothetical protein C7I87_19515 [Mesorhizobium sp. SARCC-RB16n]